jgi:hypothetical protein
MSPFVWQKFTKYTNPLINESKLLKNRLGYIDLQRKMLNSKLSSILSFMYVMDTVHNIHALGGI